MTRRIRVLCLLDAGVRLRVPELPQDGLRLELHEQRENLVVHAAIVVAAAVGLSGLFCVANKLLTLHS